MPKPISIDAINALLDSAPAASPETTNHVDSDQPSSADIDAELMALNAQSDAKIETDLDAEIEAELLAEATAESRDIVKGETFFDPVINTDDKKEKDMEGIYEEVSAELESIIEPPTKPSKKLRITPTNPASTIVTDDVLSAMMVSRDDIDSHISGQPISVQKKINNMILFLQDSADLSIYIIIGLNTLLSEKIANGTDFCQALMDYPPRPYPFDTAHKQAAQLVSLFPFLGITERKGNAQHINLASPFVQAFVETSEYVPTRKK